MEFTLLPAGATGDKLICSDPTIPHDDSNLVIKVTPQWLSAQRAGFAPAVVVSATAGRAAAMGFVHCSALELCHDC